MFIAPVLVALCAQVVFCMPERHLHTNTCRNISLASSTWPSDHGDSSRTKFTVNAGLPKGDLDVMKMKIVNSTTLNAPQWIYTYGEDNELLFVMGGTITATYVAKLDSQTLEVLQQTTLKPAMYIGGLLMHANGNVYAVQGNTLTVFWQGDLNNATAKTIPYGHLNSNVVQTNGMVGSSDGYLVIKQWSFILEDAGLYLFALPVLGKVIYAFAGVFALLSVCLVPSKKRNVVSLTVAMIIGSVVGLVVLVGLFIAFVAKTYGTFDPVPFLTSNLLVKNMGDGGRLNIIDPISLEIVADLKLTERCSFGRSALVHLDEEEGKPREDAIVLVGDEFIRQYRWNLDEKRLYEVEDWAQRYRTRNTGTFPGTGPAIYNGVTYFTDNTFPIWLGQGTYSLFSKRLQIPADRKDEKEYQMKRVSLLDNEKEDSAGFMFWSVVISPLEGDVIVWDSAHRSVQCRRADDLSLRWNLTAYQGDCMTLAADKGHVYLTDYSEGPADWSTWMASVAAGSKAMYPRSSKYFIVADTATGKVLLNTTIMTGEGMKAQLIVPAGHNDVIVGKPDGLTRIYF